MDDEIEKTAPIPPFGNGGRDANGRFTSGNAGGPGNPHSRRVAEFRRVLFDAVTEDDLREIAMTLKEQAKSGNLDATKILLDRLLGRPTQHVINENSELAGTLRLQIVEEIVDASWNDDTSSTTIVKNL